MSISSINIQTIYTYICVYIHVHTMVLTALFKLNCQLSVQVFQNILKLNGGTQFLVSSNY